MLDELSKQQRQVLLLLLIAILLGAGSLWYRSWPQGPVTVHPVSPVQSAWPGPEPDSQTKVQYPEGSNLGGQNRGGVKVFTAAADSSQGGKQATADPADGDLKPVKTETAPEEVTVALIDLNTATSEELQTIPGIGPVLASRIIEYREQVKRFERVEELLEIKGIGEKTLAKIKPYVTINP